MVLNLPIKPYPNTKKPKKIHFFDKLCQKNKIQHRAIKFKHPWTNGMVERFNQKVKNKVFKRYPFAGLDDLREKLINYEKVTKHMRL